MNCYLHPDREAGAYCRTCGRPLCADDQREIYGVVYCQECLARQVGVVSPAASASYSAPAGAAAPAAAAEPAYAAPSGHSPSPGLALALGFIPGVGAVYNVQYMKAFVQVVIFAFLIAMANTFNSDAAGTFCGLGIAAFYFYMVIDSYRTAKQMQSGQPVHDVFSLGTGTGTMNAPIAAIILIVIGGIFLLRSMGFFYYDSAKYIWPGILIAIGVYVLVRQRDNQRPS
ncbi:MAG: LiaI-LiaF-like domain-containing protein [Terriglobales bacterium]